MGSCQRSRHFLQLVGIAEQVGIAEEVGIAEQVGIAEEVGERSFGSAPVNPFQVQQGLHQIGQIKIVACQSVR